MKRCFYARFETELVIEHNNAISQFICIRSKPLRFEYFSILIKEKKYLLKHSIRRKEKTSEKLYSFNGYNKLVFTQLECYFIEKLLIQKWKNSLLMTHISIFISFIQRAQNAIIL